MVFKICGVCKRNLPETEYYKSKSNKLGLFYHCKECAANYYQMQKAKDPDKMRKYKRETTRKYRTSSRYQEFTEFLDKLKDKPCTDCGIKYPPYVMDWDHIEGKSFTIGSKKYPAGKDKILDEIAKCELVCANCHRIRTHQTKKSGRPRM